ncbi:MAG: TadE/TadG family type IV pilus assembly protein [Clostridia bacterium]
MRIRRLLKEEKGSQLIEFVLVFPLIWVLLVFTMDFFTIMYNKQIAMAAAFEAGRIASVQPNFGLARYYAESRAEDELDQAIGLDSKFVQLVPGRYWRKGEHIEARISIRVNLLASQKPYEINESYFVMVENAGD